MWITILLFITLYQFTTIYFMYVIADVNSFVVTWGLPSPKKIKKKEKSEVLGLCLQAWAKTKYAS